MWEYGRPAVRISFAIIFIWFGALKPLGMSPAEQLLSDTTSFLPFGSPKLWLHVVGYWEIVIGVLFLFKKTTRIAIGLMFLQMIGAFMPLVVLPDQVYQNRNIFTLTMEGQYIIKNILLITTTMIIGGEYYGEKHQKE